MDLEEMKRRDAALSAEIDRLREALNEAQWEQRELRIEASGVKVGDVVLAHLDHRDGDVPVEAVVRDFRYIKPVGHGGNWLTVSKRNKDGKFSKAERIAYDWERIPDEAGQ